MIAIEALLTGFPSLRYSFSYQLCSVVVLQLVVESDLRCGVAAI